MNVYQFDHNNINMLKRFIDFPYELYAADRLHIHPFRGTLEKELNQEVNPFFSYGRGVYFLIDDKGKTVGRAAAFINPKMNYDNEKVGTVGYFESIDDYTVTEQLLDAGCEWLSGQGCTVVLGPMNYSIWNKYRFKTAQVNERALYAEPHHKPYYPEYFVRYGFKSIRKWYSTEIDLQNKEFVDILAQRWKTKFKRRYEKITELGFLIKQSNPSDFEGDFKDIYRISIAAFGSHSYFYPVSFSEFSFLFGSMKQLVRKGQILLGYRNGECQGFGVHTYDYTTSLAAMKGKTSLPAKLRFLTNVKRDTVVHLFSAITPENIENRSGLASGMFYVSLNTFYFNGKTRYVIHPLMHEANRSRLYSRGVSRPVGTYELYEKRILSGR